MTEAAAQKKGTLIDAWQQQVGEQFAMPYMAELKAFLQAEKQAGKTIFPAGGDIFNSLNRTPFEQVKVVIIGQDPYHGPGQAHGFSFSVLPGVKIPPSLRNIYKELQQDTGLQPPSHGCLTSWADQGVLLLNAVLTVEQSNAGAHQGKGWETFTDAVIKVLNEKRERLVFMLWGSYAHKKGKFLDTDRHLVLKSVHPSPLSAHRGFLGCGHFSQCNTYLSDTNQLPINWASVTQL
jgi:uracil-DNA glycosylase